MPRALPPGWKPGSKAAPVPVLPDFAAIAAGQTPPPTTPRVAPKSTLAQLKDSFLDWDLYKKAIPDLFKTGLPNTLILTVSASVIGLVLGLVLAVAGHLPVAAGCAGRPGCTPTSSVACPKW